MTFLASSTVSCAFCSTVPAIAGFTQRAALVSRRPRTRLPRAARAATLAKVEGPADDEKEDDRPGVPLDMGMLAKRMREVGQSSVESKEDVVDFALAFDHSVDAELVEAHEVDEDAMRMLNEEFDQLDKLFVILFSSVGDDEGVYSLSLNGVSIVLAFQERSEARNYAMMLEAQDFPRPNVGEFSATDLKSFCGDAGFRLGLVPKGSLLTPPDENVEESLERWKSGSRGDAHGGTTLDPDEVDLMKQKFESLLGRGHNDGEQNSSDDDDDPDNTS
jgi:Protein of unknown function (DUF3110)